MLSFVASKKNVWLAVMAVLFLLIQFSPLGYGVETTLFSEDFDDLFPGLMPAADESIPPGHSRLDA